MSNQNNTVEMNQGFSFNNTSTALLVSLLSNKINLEEQILLELSKRGVGLDGEWIGFEKAARNLEHFKAKIELKEKRKEATKKSLAKKAAATSVEVVKPNAIAAKKVALNGKKGGKNGAK